MRNRKKPQRCTAWALLLWSGCSAYLLALNAGCSDEKSSDVVIGTTQAASEVEYEEEPAASLSDSSGPMPLPAPPPIVVSPPPADFVPVSDSPRDVQLRLIARIPKAERVYFTGAVQSVADELVELPDFMLSGSEKGKGLKHSVGVATVSVDKNLCNVPQTVVEVVFRKDGTAYPNLVPGQSYGLIGRTVANGHILVLDNIAVTRLSSGSQLLIDAAEAAVECVK